MQPLAVILPAAGSGRRFGGRRNKIFQPLAGRTVLEVTLGRFLARPEVCDIQVVASAADRGEILELLRACPGGGRVRVIEGGSERPESVRRALAGVPDSAGLICVHDAVRPCVRDGQIDAVIHAAAECGAAILAEPLHGTIKRCRVDACGCDTGEELPVIHETLCREGLYQAQTPQVFDAGLLRRAYGQDLTGVTDDAQLIERLGQPVRIVPGDGRNLKITRREDLAVAEAILRSLYEGEEEQNIR